MIHKFDPSWATHIPVLIKALSKTDGPVLELGLGISSTPLLHALCFDQDRHLVSYDNDLTFFEMFRNYQDSNHDIHLVKNWEEADLNFKWAVALIDHKPEARRIEEIKRLANLARFIIIHDSEPDKNDLYRYDQIYSLFKYRTDYVKTKVHATILSNFYDFN